MTKEDQRKTLHNVYETFLKLHILVEDAEKALAIKKALAVVHDALKAELEKKDELAR